MTANWSLTALSVSDPVESWEAIGFAVRDGRVEVGGVSLRLGGTGEGITGWAVDGLDAPIDGLQSIPAPPAPRLPFPPHPNGATGIDHVVILTPDFDRTARALDSAGLTLRRIRDAGGFRQGFRRLGPAILELVEARDPDPAGPARFWGLVVIVDDLDALAERLGDLLGSIRPAVQPGRRIATLSRDAGLGPAVAFMTPEPVP
jgi:hypothetical protein